MENPATGMTREVSKMGLLIFYPDKVSFEDEAALLSFPPKWLEIPWDEKGFLKFMSQIDELLVGPLPEEGKDCKWCQYRHVGEKLAHDKDSLQEEIPF